MATCKSCGVEIKDGEEYCESCALIQDLGLGDESGSNGLESGQDKQSLGNIDFLDDLNIDQEFLKQTESEEVFALDETQEQPQPEEEIFSMDEFVAEETNQTKKSSDVGDVLSDALGVLNGTSDAEAEAKLAELIPDSHKEKEKKKTKKSRKVKKEKNENEKISFFKRFFANVETDEPTITEGEFAEQKQKEKAEKKAVKEAKKKDKKDKQAEKKKVSAEKKKAKSLEKQEKKKLKAEELAKLPIDNSKINKAGAGIVFGIMAVFAFFIVIGTKSFTYAHSVSSAKNYFSMQKYEKAYDQLAGIDIKSSDEDTYNEIYTVMIVEKQLNSYENYYNMSMYAEALDSLVKGIDRYNYYIDKAKELNVESDMDYVKKEIVEALKSSFGLTESDVNDLLEIESQEAYSQEIYKLVSNLSKEN